MNFNLKNTFLLSALVGLSLSFLLPDSKEAYYGKEKDNPSFVDKGQTRADIKIPISSTEPIKYRYWVKVETSPSISLEKGIHNVYLNLEGTKSQTYEIISEKPLSLEEAYEYIQRYPNKCKQINHSKYTEQVKIGNIYDFYESHREDYLSDPEDNILYSDDIFDFLED